MKINLKVTETILTEDAKTDRLKRHIKDLAGVLNLINRDVEQMDKDDETFLAKAGAFLTGAMFGSSGRDRGK